MRAALCAMVLLVPGAAACGASAKNADLVTEVRGYADGLRWRDFNESAARLMPVRRPGFLDTREQLDEDLRVADWEMKRLTYAKGGDRADVQVEWTWMLDSRGIVHTTVTAQRWSRHGKRWILDREIRARGEPMPGVAEPAERGERGDRGDRGERGERAARIPSFTAGTRSGVQ